MELVFFAFLRSTLFLMMSASKLNTIITIGVIFQGRAARRSIARNCCLLHTERTLVSCILQVLLASTNEINTIGNEESQYI